MTSFAAAAFEHDFAAKELGPHGREPTEELFGIEWIVMIEVLPRPAKLFCRQSLVRFNLAGFGKAWDTAQYRKALVAGGTSELSFDYFFGLAPGHRALFDCTLAGRTSQILKQSFFHRCECGFAAGIIHSCVDRFLNLDVKFSCREAGAR